MVKVINLLLIIKINLAIKVFQQEIFKITYLKTFRMIMQKNTNFII
jgi:hypothetical protein